jgi:hypothetical protein
MATGMKSSGFERGIGTRRGPLTAITYNWTGCGRMMSRLAPFFLTVLEAKAPAFWRSEISGAVVEWNTFSAGVSK